MVASVTKEGHHLVVTKGSDTVVAEGQFFLSDDQGPYETFSVRIIVPEDYPKSEPKVTETANRIPPNSDRHNSGGVCCICVWEAWRAEAPDTSFDAFLKGPVANYFLSQFIFEKTRKWPFGEEQHYKPGLLDAFARSLGVQSDESLVRRYLRLLARGKLKSRWACPCGSGVEISHCHRDELSSLTTRIDPSLAKSMLRRLDNMI